MTSIAMIAPQHVAATMAPTILQLVYHAPPDWQDNQPTHCVDAQNALQSTLCTSAQASVQQQQEA